MDDLVTWLRAQLDAEYDLASRLAARYRVRNADRPDDGQPYWPLPTVEACFRNRADPDIAAGLDLIKAYGPDRVLAEVDAKRRVLDWLVDCEAKAVGNNWWVLEVADALRSLALPYAGRDGWREEWRP
jgi:hypothetical protein